MTQHDTVNKKALSLRCFTLYIPIDGIHFQSDCAGLEICGQRIGASGQIKYLPILTNFHCSPVALYMVSQVNNLRLGKPFLQLDSLQM